MCEVATSCPDLSDYDEFCGTRLMYRVPSSSSEVALINSEEIMLRIDSGTIASVLREPRAEYSIKPCRLALGGHRFRSKIR